MDIEEGSLWRRLETGRVYKVKLLRLNDRLQMVHAVGIDGLWNGSVELFRKKFKWVCGG